MMKKTAKVAWESMNKNKKVDLKVVNKKYAITFPKTQMSISELNPSILGMNDKNEIRIVVNTQDNDVDEIVQHIKSAFHDYVKEMAKKEIIPQIFYDVVCQEESDALYENMITLHINSDHLVLESNQTIQIAFSQIVDIYVEKRSNLNQSNHPHQGDRMQYALAFDNWIVIECFDNIYCLRSDEAEKLFLALSHSYFMSQMKKEKQI